MIKDSLTLKDIPGLCEKEIISLLEIKAILESMDPPSDPQSMLNLMITMEHSSDTRRKIQQWIMQNTATPGAHANRAG